MGREVTGIASESEVAARAGGGVGVGAGFPFGQPPPVRCERTLIFRDGRVSEQTWTGAPEYCASFGR